METVTVGEHRMITLRLDALQPNPYRDLDTNPLDESVVQAILKSIEEFDDFWLGMLCVCIDGQHHLVFGHHRLEAAKRHFGPAYEVTLELVDYQGWELIKALHNENTARTSLMAHDMEVVQQAARFLDDVVLAECPDWKSYLNRSEKNLRPIGFPTVEQMRSYFGTGETAPDQAVAGNYAVAVKTGVGKRVISRALGDKPGPDKVQEVLEQFGPTLTERRAAAAEAVEAVTGDDEVKASPKPKPVYDPKVGAVFQRTAWAKAMRQFVQREDVNPYLPLEQQVPFAKHILKLVERRDGDVTAPRITITAEMEFQVFRKSADKWYKEVERELSKAKPEEVGGTAPKSDLEKEEEERQKALVQLRKKTTSSSNKAKELSAALAKIVETCDDKGIDLLSGPEVLQLVSELAILRGRIEDVYEYLEEPEPKLKAVN